MLGVVNLDKPVGPTSHDMVDLLRRLTGTRRIGHAGTLDPMASGILPILVGGATRFSQELTGGDKRYEAVIRLGQRSATDDAEGPIEPGPALVPDEAQVAAAVRSFVGEIVQRPPSFSARKQGGRAAYRAARQGEPLELAPRTVVVRDIALLGSEDGDGWRDLRLDIRCGAGTYVRAIARDLGELLGCGGHLHALRRTEAAGLRVADARTPEQLTELAAAGRLNEALVPVTRLLHMPCLDLARPQAERFRHGAAVRLAEPHAEDGTYLVLASGQLLGIGRSSGGWLRPTKVLAPEESA